MTRVGVTEVAVSEPAAEVGAWRKSSRSGSHNASCVEVGWLGPAEERALVRDSKCVDGGVLGFSRADWLRLLRGVGS